MKPDLEVVQIGRGESFRAYGHCYPYPTVRWHFHPEYELHHVVATTGRYFVGDFIGTFEPGNLVLTGPNLPHNWISDVAPGEVVPLRNRVLQFTDEAIRGAIEVLPELQRFTETLDKSRSGVLFSDATSKRVGIMLAELVEATGIRRLELFIGIAGILHGDKDARLLTSAEYVPDPSAYMSAGLNAVLTYINANLSEPFTEDELAEIAGLSRSAFCRSFRRHTGQSLVRYLNRLRINLACQLLTSEENMKVADVCFAAGFNNLSNFNRQFAEQKGMTPSRFRHELLQNMSLTNGLLAIAGPPRRLGWQERRLTA